MHHTRSAKIIYGGPNLTKSFNFRDLCLPLILCIPHNKTEASDLTCQNHFRSIYRFHPKIKTIGVKLNYIQRINCIPLRMSASVT
uniref:Uncharacterized protein n=1 Tax=Manihot esculenta TaxID=3983 RepID=A0A2C9U7G6_MANES